MIDGKEMVMRCSALLPRQYRYHFNRDLMIDLKRALDKSNKTPEEVEANPGESLDALDMTVFENIAWLMLKSGGNDVGADPEEWLSSIDDSMVIYNLIPVVVELWISNTATTARPKKK